jgi:tRNA dimethylallyltransferase
MPKHKLDLFAGDTRKPFEKIVDTRATLKIFEERPDRNTGLSEKPFAADLIGRTFHRRALAPIKHGVILSASGPACKPRGSYSAFAILIRAKTDYVKAVSKAEIILIAGPTASGKSALALELAAACGGTIINADSMQVYRDLRVITARPTADEETRVPHRLYGHVDAAENYSTGRWCVDAAAALAAAKREGRTAILVGGTGLYYKALTRGLAAVPPIAPDIRNAVRSRLATNGVAALYAELVARDPAVATRLMPNDRARVTRALEVVLATGRSLRDWHKEGLPASLDPAVAAKVFLTPDRDELSRRIDSRFDAMMAAGALEEVRALAARKLDDSLPAMKAHGVPWLVRHLNGEISIDDAIEHAKLETRQYTKRQATWFRNQLPEFAWVTPERASEAVEAQLRALVK